MADAEIVREVTRCVEEAIGKNRRIETVLIVILVCVSAVGVGLLVFGAYIRQWAIALPGGLCELALAMPIRYLVQLRRENIRLAVLPQMLRMADTASEKKLVLKFIERLIEKI
jgi:hypothetical protein